MLPSGWYVTRSTPTSSARTVAWALVDVAFSRVVVELAHRLPVSVVERPDVDVAGDVAGHLGAAHLGQEVSTNRSSTADAFHDRLGRQSWARRGAGSTAAEGEHAYRRRTGRPPRRARPGPSCGPAGHRRLADSRARHGSACRRVRQPAVAGARPRRGLAATIDRREPRPSSPTARGLDRRGRPDADRALWRRARDGAAGRPGGPRAASRRRPRRRGSGPRRGRHPRLRQPGRRGQPRRRADGGPAGRLPGRGRRADRQPPVRVGAAGHQLGGARDRGRRRRRVHRRRRGVDDPGAVRHGQAGRSPGTAARASSRTRRSAGGSSTRSSPRCTTRIRWARRRRTSPSATASTASARTRSRSRASGAPWRRSRPVASTTRSSRSRSPGGRARRRSSSRDEHPARRHVRRGAGQAQAGVQAGGRQRHGREQLRASTTARRRCCSSRPSGRASSA